MRLRFICSNARFYTCRGLFFKRVFLKHSLAHVSAHTNNHTINRKKIKVLSSSSNQRKLRYGDRNNIFEGSSNGTAENILEMAW